MKFFQSRRNVVRLLTYLLAFCVLCGGAALVRGHQYRTAKDALDAASHRAMGELSESLLSITTALQKGLYCNCGTRMTALALDLRGSTVAAKHSLAQLTDEALVSDGVFKFLSQVGDFATAVGRKMQAGEPLSDGDRSELAALYAYGRSLTDAVVPLSDGFFDGSVALTLPRSTLPDESRQPKLFSQELNTAAQDFAAYPTLLYDGPFSDAALNREAPGVKTLAEIDPGTAAGRAAAALKCAPTDLRREDDVGGALPLFCFSKGEVRVTVTRHGGLVCSITRPWNSEAATLDARAAVKIARRCLRDLGYPDMHESYYSTYDGVCTVNLAYTKGGVIYYADLIKVSVALDSGAVVAMDARGYLMNHTKRSLPEQTISIKRAVRRLAPGLTLLDTATAMIPCDDSKERLCYELHCKDGDGQQALIYVDVTTGNEADIQLLTFSDGGVLAR